MVGLPRGVEGEEEPRVGRGVLGGRVGATIGAADVPDVDEGLVRQDIEAAGIEARGLRVDLDSGDPVVLPVVAADRRTETALAEVEAVDARRAEGVEGEARLALHPVALRPGRRPDRREGVLQGDALVEPPGLADDRDAAQLGADLPPAARRHVAAGRLGLGEVARAVEGRGGMDAAVAAQGDEDVEARHRALAFVDAFGQDGQGEGVLDAGRGGDVGAVRLAAGSEGEVFAFVDAQAPSALALGVELARLGRGEAVEAVEVDDGDAAAEDRQVPVRPGAVADAEHVAAARPDAVDIEEAGGGGGRDVGPAVLDVEGEALAGGDVVDGDALVAVVGRLLGGADAARAPGEVACGVEADLEAGKAERVPREVFEVRRPGRLVRVVELPQLLLGRGVVVDEDFHADGAADGEGADAGDVLGGQDRPLDTQGRPDRALKGAEAREALHPRRLGQGLAAAFEGGVAGVLQADGLDGPGVARAHVEVEAVVAVGGKAPDLVEALVHPGVDGEGRRHAGRRARVARGGDVESDQASAARGDEEEVAELDEVAGEVGVAQGQVTAVREGFGGALAGGEEVFRGAEVDAAAVGVARGLRQAGAIEDEAEEVAPRQDALEPDRQVGEGSARLQLERDLGR